MKKGMLWDTHIHLEQYGDRAHQIVREAMAAGICRMVAVSTDMASCQRTLELAEAYPELVLPAFGVHPEQALPSEVEVEQMFQWMEQQRRRGLRFAVGEVGLPYYTRKKALRENQRFDLEPYVAMLEQFVRYAAQWDVPIVLHAVYEDAHLALRLLEKYGVRRAHFHWFKGDEQAVKRIIARGYMVSFTPDCRYNPVTAALLTRFPLDLILAETDGPWPYEGPYLGRQTHPAMVADVIREIARRHGLSVQEVAARLGQNAERLYGQSSC